MEVLIDREREVSLSVSLRQYVNWLHRHAPPRPAAVVNEGAMSADHAIAAAAGAAVVSAATSASARAAAAKLSPHTYYNVPVWPTSKSCSPKIHK